MRKARIKVKTKCVGDNYACRPQEKIIEISGTRLGALISLWEDDDGNIQVSLYRADPGVTISQERDNANIYPPLSHRERMD